MFVSYDTWSLREDIKKALEITKVDFDLIRRDYERKKLNRWLWFVEKFEDRRWIYLTDEEVEFLESIMLRNQ